MKARELFAVGGLEEASDAFVCVAAAAVYMKRSRSHACISLAEEDEEPDAESVSVSKRTVAQLTTTQ